MIDSRACPECGAEVAIGRLSCGACGAFLASVDRRGRDDPGPFALEVPPAEVSSPARSNTPTDEPAAAPEAASIPSRAPSIVPTDEPPAAPEAAAAELEEIVPPRPPMPPIPGAYLAPSIVARSAPIPAAPPVTPAPASTPVPIAPAAPVPAPGQPHPALQPVEPAAGSPARVPVLELPFVLAPGIGPRLVAAGAGLAVVAFVLPWVSDGGVVIGGAFGSGYFAAWGLAAIGNVIPFLLGWVSLLLAVLPNRVPRIAALGVLPVLLGGVLAGLGWTYLIAPFGAGIGIWALAVSALLLVAGGSLVLRGERGAG